MGIRTKHIDIFVCDQCGIEYDEKDSSCEMYKCSLCGKDICGECVNDLIDNNCHIFINNYLNDCTGKSRDHEKLCSLWANNMYAFDIYGIILSEYVDNLDIKIEYEKEPINCCEECMDKMFLNENLLNHIKVFIEQTNKLLDKENIFENIKKVKKGVKK